MIITIESYLKQIRLKSPRRKDVDVFFNDVKHKLKLTLAQKTFAEHGCDCGSCGAKGEYATLVKHYHNPNQSPKVSGIIEVYAKKKNGQLVRMTTDHIVPKKFGGTNHVKTNLQPMCLDCNRTKSSLMPSEIMLGKQWWKRTLVDFAKVYHDSTVQL